MDREFLFFKWKNLLCSFHRCPKKVLMLFFPYGFISGRTFLISPQITRHFLPEILPFSLTRHVRFCSYLLLWRRTHAGMQRRARNSSSTIVARIEQKKRPTRVSSWFDECHLTEQRNARRSVFTFWQTKIIPQTARHSEADCGLQLTSSKQWLNVHAHNVFFLCGWCFFTSAVFYYMAIEEHYSQFMHRA